MFSPDLPVKISVLANTLLFGLFSTNVNAALTSYTANGVDLVYSSVSNVTWTKDANLLGSMIAADSNVIQSIVNASTNNYSALSYTVTASDFSTNGLTTWFGANAFITYLNAISYAGSTSWKLPTFDSSDLSNGGFNIPSNGSLSGNEFSELYYQELNGTIGSNSIANSSDFLNVDFFYHSRTLATAMTVGGGFLTGDVWGFSTGDGSKNYNSPFNTYYAWAINQGTISEVSAVPAPAAVWLFVSGLPLITAASRRRKQTI